jgi:CHAT domain-containing protein
LIVVTGLGAVTAFGWGVAPLWEGLHRGVPAIGPITRFDGTRHRTHLAAEVPLEAAPQGTRRASWADRFAVAADLKVGGDDVLLGSRATEAAVKDLSTSGRLANYRVVHFATHGMLAGDLSGVSEPGLLMTPPEQQTEADDGYLSASEVAELKLDADWVILSACNTAAGGSEKAEALSGLARAFFYAGARALLVSHWAVDSAATVRLTTTAMNAMSREKGMGRAQAMRNSMLGMIDDKGKPALGHPTYWAPFVVVGEGAAQQ